MSADKIYENIKTKAGQQLYGLLPEVYRSRDASKLEGRGDLAKFLDACGEVLDRVRNTLDQRLADSFPDNPEDGRSCQSWLLPYFAQLLDVRLVSPDEKGRRDEVANAVAWRQRKGTRTDIEQIAEAVAQVEAEVQEGWKRVATTPRIGMPLLPAKALGESQEFDDHKEHPLWAARHPGLPSVTVDLRYPSRAMQLEVQPAEFPQNPAARLTKFAGEEIWWRQVNPHGAPCFPGSYDDIARRTVDLRTAGWQHGHFHPKRVLLFRPPPQGFFEADLFPSQEGLELAEDREHVLKDQIVKKTLKVTAGRLRLIRCAVEDLKIEVPPAIEENEAPVLVAEDCLIGEGIVNGLVRLEYCTTLGTFECDRLQASDSLFAGALSLHPATDEAPHCLRYSRIPPGLSVAGLLTYQNTVEAAVFYEFEFDEGGEVVRRRSLFGEPGCAVLHPATPEAIRFGAEDGGEMGAFHGWRYSLLMAAVQDKLKDFLPVGIEAVIIPDLRLHRMPAPPC